MKACINGIYSLYLLCKGSLAIESVKVQGLFWKQHWPNT